MIDFMTQEQVLEEEIKLLNMPGQSLANYYQYQPDDMIFFPAPQLISNSLYRDHKLTNPKTCHPHPNNCFYLTSLTLLSYLAKNPSITQKLKLTLYSPKLNLCQILNFPYPHLSNGQMKKILVQFLQILSYFKGDISQILSKYKIVVEILSVYFRCLLMKIGVPGVENYGMQINGFVVLTHVLDFFDVFYQVTRDVVFLEDSGICVFVNQKFGNVYVADRVSSQEPRKSRGGFCLGLGDEDEDEDIDYGDNFIKKDSVGMAPTPCFGEISWQDSPTKKNSVMHEQSRDHKNKPPLISVQEQKETHESGSLKRLQQFKQQCDATKQAQKFKSILSSLNTDHYDQIDFHDRQFNNTRIHSNRESKETKDNIHESRRSNGKNDSVKVSGFHFPGYDDDGENKSCKSENIARKNRRNTDDNSEEESQREYSNYDTEREKSNRIQSCVVELKIEPTWQHKYKTFLSQKIKQKRVEIMSEKNNKNRQNKTFGKMPQFFNQKLRNSNPNSPTLKIQQNKHKKPKVTFTYGITERLMIPTPNLDSGLGAKVKYYTQPSSGYSSINNPSLKSIGSKEIRQTYTEGDYIPAYIKKKGGQYQF